MSNFEPSQDVNKLFEQRLIEGMRTASDQAMSMSKWLIATLMTTNTAGLYYGLKVSLELKMNTPIPIYCFAVGCFLALLTGLITYWNFTWAVSHFEKLLYMTPHARHQYANIDKKGRFLDILNILAIICGLTSTILFISGVYLLASANLQ